MKSLLLWIKVVGLMTIMIEIDCLQKSHCPSSTTSVTKQPLKPIDFEDESSSSILIDQSQGPVKWKIENYNSSSKPSAPRPASGYKYIRVDRGSINSFGVAVLSFPDLLLTSFETLTVSFSFWISSKWSKFNNLQLYAVENGHQTLIKELWEYSNNQMNQEWNVVNNITHRPSGWSTNVSFVFYAFCGTNEEDAIAIDNILVTQLATNSNSRNARIDTSTTPIMEATNDFTTEHISTKEYLTTENNVTPITYSSIQTDTPEYTSTTKIYSTIEYETTYCN